MRAPIVVSTLIVIAAGAGCKKSKKDKCEAAYDQMMALVKEMEKMAKEMGGEASEKPSADEKKKFMAMCEKLPDDAIECLSLEKMLDEECAEKLEKAEAEAMANEPPLAIEWESAPAAEKKATAKVPKGWKHEEFMGDRWTPPEDADLGFFTSYSVGSTCGGSCEALPAAEWVKRIDEYVVTPMKQEDGGAIVKDEPLGDGGRLLVSTSKMGRKTLHKVTAVFWKEGGSEYFTCVAELDPRLAKNVPDFEQACRDLKIEWPAAEPAPAPAE
jgi:hypothetical protein